MIKLFKPEVQLVRTPTKSGKGVFHLHAITITDQTNYVASGYEIAKALDQDGMLTISLYIEQDPQALDFRYFQPVTHTFTIGELPFEDDFGVLHVVVLDNSAQARSVEPRGSTQVGGGDADEDDRPIGQ